jgi:Flp pilus assembly protein TadD
MTSIRVLLYLVVACGASILLGGCTQSKQVVHDRPSTVSDADMVFQAERDRPPTAKTLFTMADILATQGKDTQCEFVLRRCIQMYPAFVPAYNRLAELQMRQGRAAEAGAVLTKALEVSPGDSVLLNNLGMSLLVREEYEQALDQFRAAVESAPGKAKYQANVATALGLLGRYEESLALLLEVLPEEQARNNAEILRRASEVEPISSPATVDS